MRTCKIHSFFWCIILVLTIATGCSSSSSNNTPAISLANDTDRDGIPDELKAEVDGIIALAGGRVDESELGGLLAAYEKFDKRLPYTDRVRELLREMSEINSAYEALPDDEKTEAAFLRVQDEIQERLNQLEHDKTFAAVQDYIDEILEPEGTGESDSQDWVGNEKWNSLKRGDVMLIKSPDLELHQKFYVWKYSHAGVYNGNNLVYEAIGEGIALRPIAKWKKSGVYVGLGRSNTKSESEVCTKLDEILNTFGDDNATAYNYIIPMKTSYINVLKFNDAPRYREKALYCSQLVWWLHNYLLGYDIDSNDVRYYTALIAQFPPARLIVEIVLIPGVLPDEIAFSPFIDMYAAGPNSIPVIKPSSISCFQTELITAGESPVFTATGASSPDGMELEYNFKVEVNAGGVWKIIHNSWQSESSVEISIPKMQSVTDVSVSVRVREKDVVENESAWVTQVFAVLDNEE